MTLHVLKTDVDAYQAVLDGRKRAEVRLDDRGYQTDDTVTLRERNPDTGQYTGRQATYIVGHIYQRPERHWSWQDIDRHGLILLTLEAPQVAYSDLNPHRAAEGHQPCQHQWIREPTTDHYACARCQTTISRHDLIEGQP